MNKNLDQFFTKKTIAKQFVNKIKEIINLDKYDNIVEPGAGSGNILELLPKHNRIGLDLDPQHPEVLPMDFFDYEFPRGTTIVVGNPPFGPSSKLAIQFFNKCAKYADTICFIVPRSWMKHYIQNRLDKSFKLYQNIVLPDNAFTFDNEDYEVKCVAQIWSKHELNITDPFVSWNPTIPQSKLNELDKYQLKHNCYNHSELFGNSNNIRLWNKLPTQHKDFIIKMPPYKHMYMHDIDWDYLVEWGLDYDFVILGTSGRCVDTDDFSNLQQRYYVKGDREIFEKIDLKAFDWMAIGNFGGIAISALVFSYEQYINKIK